MSVKLENVGKNTVMLEIEVEYDEFNRGMNKAYEKNRGKFTIPGFRKGKAPRGMVERYYGETVLYNDAVEIICPGAYDEAVRETGIYPVDTPEIDIKQIGNKEPFIFTAKVVVKPDVILGDYEGIKMEKEPVIVSEDDVKKELDRVASENSRIVPVEGRPLQEGDIAVIDYKGTVDGVPFEGGKAEGHNLTIGSGNFIPGFESQLTGMETGSERDIEVTFPEDYHSEDLKGKPAVFHVKLNEIKFKEIPQIDDEFAKDVSEFDTLDGYKESILQKLLKNAEENANRALENKLIEKIAGLCEVDIPEVMIKKQIDSYIDDMKMSLYYQRLNLEKYLEIMKKSEEDLRKSYEDRANNDVKIQLMLEKISRKENIAANEDDLTVEIEKIANDYRQSVEEVRKKLGNEQLDYLKHNIVINKTVKHLLEKALS